MSKQVDNYVPFTDAVKWTKYGDSIIEDKNKSFYYVSNVGNILPLSGSPDTIYSCALKEVTKIDSPIRQFAQSNGLSLGDESQSFCGPQVKGAGVSKLKEQLDNYLKSMAKRAGTRSGVSSSLKHSHTQAFDLTEKAFELDKKRRLLEAVYSDKKLLAVQQGTYEKIALGVLALGVIAFLTRL